MGTTWAQDSTFPGSSLSDIVSNCKNSCSRITIRQHQGTNVAILSRHKKVLNPCITISDKPQTFLLLEALPNSMIASNKSVGRFVPANSCCATIKFTKFVQFGFNSQPKFLKLHLTQLVPVYISPTHKFTILYFNFHLV